MPARHLPHVGWPQRWPARRSPAVPAPQVRQFTRLTARDRALSWPHRLDRIGV